MTPLTLAFAALVVLFIAAVALCGFLYLYFTERHPERPKIKTEACDLGLHGRCMKDWCNCSCHVESPVWVNHHSGTRRRCHR
jgi:hypothetical protein